MPDAREVYENSAICAAIGRSESEEFGSCSALFHEILDLRFNRPLNLPAAGTETFFLWSPRQTGKTPLLKRRYPQIAGSIR